MLVKITSRVFISTSKTEIVHIEHNGSERTVKITRPEANIITFLNENKGNVFSKEHLTKVGWNGRITGANSINVAIYNLRKYLSVDTDISIENIPREGYKLNIVNQSVSVTKEENDSSQYKGVKSEKEKNRKHLYLSSNHFRKLKITILVFLNLLFITFILTIYLNLVWVECDTSENGKVCHSRSYHLVNQEKQNIPKGFSVRSHHNSSNIRQ